jgi:predicted N-acetyltransferase YhbS
VTLSDNATVKDEDIELPGKPKADGTKGGHQVVGRTICLHSLAVLPELQKAKVGSTLMKSYIQMVQDSKVIDRIALITSEDLVPFYEKLGFENKGKSESQHGGHDWYDLVSTLNY